MPKMDFYYMAFSPPCRAVLLLARHLKVELNLKTLNVLEKEQMQPFFLKINPQHTIPTLVDGDLALWESRAIMQYLANKYDVEGKLYPTDLKQRAKVNQILNFDMASLYLPFMKYFIFYALGREDSLDPVKKDKLEEGLQFLETFLQKQNFVAGNDLTIADHAVATTVSTIKELDVVDLAKYVKISEWLSRCEQEIPDYDDISSGSLKEMKSLLKK